LYLLALYQLPNRAFLTNIRDLSLDELSNNMKALLGYSLLEIASLLIVGFLLQRQTRVSSLRQLAFVLSRSGSSRRPNCCSRSPSRCRRRWSTLEPTSPSASRGSGIDAAVMHIKCRLRVPSRTAARMAIRSQDCTAEAQHTHWKRRKRAGRG
jgi:hypothetical protein